VERYRDAQALWAHQATPYFEDAVAKLPEWLAVPPEFEEFGQLAPA
jgi:quinol monooxygenase YgiN